MNNELRCLTNWIRANKLSLNEFTTKLLIFRPTSKLSTIIPNIKPNYHLLTPEKFVTYFGI